MYNVTEKKRKFDLRGHLRLLEVIKVTEVIEAKKATRHRGLKTKQKSPSSVKKPYLYKANQKLTIHNNKAIMTKMNSNKIEDFSHFEFDFPWPLFCRA